MYRTPGKHKLITAFNNNINNYNPLSDIIIKNIEHNEYNEPVKLVEHVRNIDNSKNDKNIEHIEHIENKNNSTNKNKAYTINKINRIKKENETINTPLIEKQKENEIIIEQHRNRTIKNIKINKNNKPINTTNIKDNKKQISHKYSINYLNNKIERDILNNQDIEMEDAMNNLNIFDDNENNKIIKNCNGFDILYYINLDRSTSRKIYIEQLLNKYKINYVRISAINGDELPSIKTTFIDTKNNKNNKNNKKNINELTDMMPTNTLSVNALGCLLSHLKTIKEFYNSGLKNCLIIEDDISIENFKYLEIDLEDIILCAPLHDILIIGKTCNYELDSLYTKWTKGIWGTFGYIINRHGAEKILNYYKTNNDYTEFIFNTDILSVADVFIYEKLITYAYKYSLITDISNYSTIHKNNVKLHKKSNKIQNNIIIRDINKNIL